MVNNGFATDSLGNIAYPNVVGSTVSGAAGGNETRPVNIYVNYIIKY